MKSKYLEKENKPCGISQLTGDKEKVDPLTNLKKKRLERKQN